MNSDHFIRELRQIQLIQEKLINAPGNQEGQNLDQVINNIESFNNTIVKLADYASSNQIESAELFVTMLKDELTSPLVPITIYADMLLKQKFGKLSQEQKEKISIIMSNANQLQQKITTLVNRNVFEKRITSDITTSQSMRESEQTNLLLKEINKLLSRKIIDDSQEMKLLRDSLDKSDRRQRELEQEKIIIGKTMELNQKIFQSSKKYYVLIIISVVGSASFAGYLYAENLDSDKYAMLKNYNSNYVIQDLKGDVVNTWVEWKISPDRILHVNILNTANLSQDKIYAVKDAILSIKTLDIDDSLLGKGASGTSSVYYEGWEGALTNAYSTHTISYIPQKFDVSDSLSNSGDIQITLTNDISPDGLSGITRSIADGNQILKSKITIYVASQLTANQLGAITRHEFGHAMGLAHSSASEDLMHATIQTNYPYISGCDVDAIRGLYNDNERSTVVCQK